MFKKYCALLLITVLFTACGDSNSKIAIDGEEIDPKELALKVEEYKVAEASKCKKPQTVRELSGGMQKIFYQINADNSANLALFGGTGINLGKKEVMVIVDFMQHKDVTCEEKTRYGVGVRLFLHIKKAHKKLDLNNLPQLAANVQLGKASVQYVFKTIGVTGNKINALIPRSATNNFDVESYANVISAVDKIQNLIKDNIDGVVIDPQQIPLK